MARKDDKLSRGAAADEDRSSSGRTAQIVKRTATNLAGRGIDQVRKSAELQKNMVADRLEDLAEIVRNAAQRGEGPAVALAGGVITSGANGLTHLAEGIRGREVEEFVDDARSAIARHPVLAIGAASLFGIAVGRIVKGGMLMSANVDRSLSNRRQELAA